MSKLILEEIFACPVCKTYLQNVKTKGKCPKCIFKFQKKDGIWEFLYTKGKRTLASLKEYDISHKEKSGRPNDGSYEILAGFARGNKTLDIACGEGFIEELAGDTVGVEFSINALKKARKKGIKNLVLADAHHLPFRDNSFDLVICHGSLEHFEFPLKVVKEMARVSRIQIMTVHKKQTQLFNFFYTAVSKSLNVKLQPIEEPISFSTLEKILKNAGLHIVFKGVWTLPVNYGRPIRFLPEFKNIPSCCFTISIKDSFL